MPDSVAVQLADIFSGDIDFHRQLRKGDRFSVVYETMEADGEPMRAGRVLSAEFVNNGKTHTAVWFKEPQATKGEYYIMPLYNKLIVEGAQIGLSHAKAMWDMGTPEAKLKFETYLNGTII